MSEKKSSNYNQLDTSINEVSLSSASQEVPDYDITSQLNDAQRSILVLKQTIDEKTSTLHEERAIFEEMRKILDRVHFANRIKMNVGGQVFKTSIETLVKDPDSMLAAMFSQRFDVKPDEEDGAYFIDRDGTHFRYILNYLRNGKLNVNLNENKAVTSELYAEAEFYQISGLQKEIWPGPCFEDSSHIIHSLNSEQMNALMSWLPPTPDLHNWVQRYSGITNGWSCSTFHKNCDERGPTIVIARSGKVIFGGYARASWNTCSSFVKDDNSFLFLLTKASGSEDSPTKLPQNNGGIWCSSSYGAVFGSSAGKVIQFMYDGSSSGCKMSGSYGFTVPGGASLCTFLGLGESITLSYCEIFSLGKCF